VIAWLNLNNVPETKTFFIIASKLDGSW